MGMQIILRKDFVVLYNLRSMSSINSSPCFFHHFFAIYKTIIQAINHSIPNKINMTQVADNMHNTICHHSIQLLQMAIIIPIIIPINIVITNPSFSILYYTDCLGLLNCSVLLLLECFYE